MGLTFEQAVNAMRVNRPFDSKDDTRAGVVMPLLSSMGYDVFNTKEVTPSRVIELSDGKKGRVDVCIRDAAEVFLAIRCYAEGAQIERSEQESAYVMEHTKNVKACFVFRGTDMSILWRTSSGKFSAQNPLRLQLLNYKDKELASSILKYFTKDSIKSARLDSILEECRVYLEVQDLKKIFASGEEIPAYIMDAIKEHIEIQDIHDETHTSYDSTPEGEIHSGIVVTGITEVKSEQVTPKEEQAPEESIGETDDTSAEPEVNTVEAQVEVSVSEDTPDDDENSPDEEESSDDFEIRVDITEPSDGNNTNGAPSHCEDSIISSNDDGKIQDVNIINVTMQRTVWGKLIRAHGVYNHKDKSVIILAGSQVYDGHLTFERGKGGSSWVKNVKTKYNKYIKNGVTTEDIKFSSLAQASAFICSARTGESSWTTSKDGETMTLKEYIAQYITPYQN